MANIYDIKNIINDPKTVKVVGTVGIDGIPHTAIKQTLYVNDEGNIEYIELFESSKSYRNVTGSLWYNKKVSISIYSENNESYAIVGEPKSIIVSGREFEKAYTKVLEEKGFDIAAIITIVPDSIDNQSPKEKFVDQEKTRVFFRHLDRLSKDEDK